MVLVQTLPLETFVILDFIFVCLWAENVIGLWRSAIAKIRSSKQKMNAFWRMLCKFPGLPFFHFSNYGGVGVATVVHLAAAKVLPMAYL